MTNQFQHFVITRFNIKSKDWLTDKNAQPVNDSNWLKDRIELFEHFCFPSMCAQTIYDFTWFVFFDVNPTDLLTKKIAEWTKKCTQFCPVYVRDYDTFIEHDIEKTIRKHLRESMNYIITTRIDNDDAFHEDALKTIQANFTPNHHQIIDLEYGYCLGINQQILLKRRYESNPFISLIEEVSETTEIKSVMKEGHPAWIGLVNFTSVITKPLWIQVIHEKNVSNSLKGETVLCRRKMKNFHVRFLFKAGYFWHAVKFLLKKQYFKAKHNLKILLKKISS